ncbi:MAG: hypothetical protein P9L92_03830 [Candidatus Electryonea clarkiae]|nr:hypothetical protein [Candidatus Electryonea clarkiae]MDP8286946.1 hypothetical protein [Candidatus Electryonea clarkiae]
MDSKISNLILSPEDYWLGNPQLLSKRTCAILNSRQSKYPLGSEPWIINTVRAVNQCSRNDLALMTSDGLKTWELSLWASAEALGSVVILTGINKNENRAAVRTKQQSILDNFKLLNQDTLIIPYLETEKRGKGKTQWLARDRWIIDNSDILYPVSIREGGFMHKTIGEDNIKKKCNDAYRVDYNPGKMVFPKPPDTEIIDQIISKFDWHHAVHWTRSTYEPWQGETKSQFYSDIVSSDSKYARSAFRTLMNILKERRIRATSWRMPSSTPMVSFTAAHPSSFVPIMKWRKRYVRPSFEPYGIAFERNSLLKSGAKPIKYDSPENLKTLNSRERLFYQATSDKGNSWSEEKEWRLVGDYSFDFEDNAQMIVFVMSDEECFEVKKNFDCNVVALASNAKATNR